MKLTTKIRKQEAKIQSHGIFGMPGGLLKTHRIIKTENDKEIQFQKLCSKIKLKDFKTERAETQRNERKLKRNQ